MFLQPLSGVSNLTRGIVGIGHFPIMAKKLLILLAAGLISSVPIVTYAQAKSATPAKPADERANFFPPRMQSFPLYGDAAIPNSKPGPDEGEPEGQDAYPEVSVRSSAR